MRCDESMHHRISEGGIRCFHGWEQSVSFRSFATAMILVEYCVACKEYFLARGIGDKKYIEMQIAQRL